MKTELVNKIANETIYELQYEKKFYLDHKKINKKILILFSTLNICLSAIHVFYYLNFI